MELVRLDENLSHRSSDSVRDPVADVARGTESGTFHFEVAATEAP